jgi:hypothetical protein
MTSRSPCGLTALAVCVLLGVSVYLCLSQSRA